MPFTHAVAIGLDAADLQALGRQLERVAPGLAVEGVAAAAAPPELAVADPGCLLVVPYAAPGVDGTELLRRLRGRAVLAPAILLVTAAELRAGVSPGGLGAVDLLPRDGYTAFDLQRALALLDHSRGMAQRLGELELRLRDAEAERLAGQRRLDDLSHQLALLAVDDELTGLRNERYMLQRVEESVRLARRYETPVACLLLGLDDLDEVRERCSHSFADHVLVQAAARLKRAIRSTDLLSRYGRQEFLLLASLTTLHGATVLAQRLLDVVAGEPVERQPHSVRPSISAGVAAFRGGMAGPGELIQSAAEALAQARARGRQQIEAL
jgi:diguanylate cyclase (GGDEF)-like protein